jgi:flagellar protein FlaG
METRIREVQPMVAENWVKYDSSLQESPLVTPVAKSGEDSSVKSQTEGESRAKDQGGGSHKNRELAEQVQKFMEDLSIGVSFEVREKTGELIVQVRNRDTGDVIRQIPPEDLVKFHDKLAELRGVLFEEKV